MKSLLAIAVLFSAVSSHANTFTCAETNKAGDSFAVQINSENVEGMVKMSDAKGTSTGTYILRTYIMNDNSPGFYYFEGLAKEPGNPDPKFFRMKFSHDDQTAKMIISHVGGKAFQTVNMSKCSIEMTKSALSR